MHMCLRVLFGVIPAINEIASIAAAACAGYKIKSFLKTPSGPEIYTPPPREWGFLLYLQHTAHLTDLSCEGDIIEEVSMWQNTSY